MNQLPNLFSVSRSETQKMLEVLFLHNVHSLGAMNMLSVKVVNADRRYFIKCCDPQKVSGQPQVDRLTNSQHL